MLWEKFCTYMFDRHYDKVDRQACALSPEYAALKKSAEGQRGTRWEDFKRELAICEELGLDRHTWLHQVCWWTERHGPSVQWSNIKRFYQRGNRGWAVRDTWALKHYLSRVMAESIEYLRDHGHGYPGFGDADTSEKWYAILTEIIEGFRAIEAMEELKIGEGPDGYAAYREAEEALYAKTKHSFKLLSEWWPYLWD